MKSVRGSSLVVSVAVLGSRVFGLVRDSVFAAMFGCSWIWDSYLAAFQIPNLMRDMFAEGALSTAFTATFTKLWVTGGEVRAWALANRLFSTIVVLIGLICTVGILLSGPIVHVTNFGFSPEKLALTTTLTRIMFPFILLASLASVIMGILNSRNIFGIPASASTAFNIVSVLSGFGLACWLDPQAHVLQPHFGVRAAYAVSIGTMLGGLAQIGIQIPSLLRVGFKNRWTWGLKDEALVNVWRLMWPGVIAGAAVQVNVIVSGMFASEINGARSWLYFAFRLVQFPIGMFGVAIATATLPAVARFHAVSDLKSFGKTAEESLRLAIFLTLPAAAGLAALAPQLMAVIYQRGGFTANDTHQTAMALRAYSVGLTGYSLIKVLTVCFQALGLPKIPFRVSSFGILINLLMNFILIECLHWGHVGLAATVGCVANANCIQLLVALSKQVPLGRRSDWVPFILKTTVASGICFGVAVGLAHRLWADQSGFTKHLVALLASVSAGTLSYFAVAMLTRVHEGSLMLQTIRRKLGAAAPSL